MNDPHAVLPQNALSSVSDLPPRLSGHLIAGHIRHLGAFVKDRDGIRAVPIHDLSGNLLDQALVVH